MMATRVESREKLFVYDIRGESLRGVLDLSAGDEVVIVLGTKTDELKAFGRLPG